MRGFVEPLSALQKKACWRDEVHSFKNPYGIRIPQKSDLPMRRFRNRNPPQATVSPCRDSRQRSKNFILNASGRGLHMVEVEVARYENDV